MIDHLLIALQVLEDYIEDLANKLLGWKEAHIFNLVWLFDGLLALLIFSILRIY